MIRWLCNKCNLKWIHPVDACINCNFQIEKQITLFRDTKFIIAGFSEITVPSTLHPKVPYTVLLLKNEHGNLMPKKTMKKFSDADIGKEFVFEKGDVAIIKAKYDYDAAVLNAISLLENFEINDYKNKRVLIHAELLSEKKDTIEKKSQLEMVHAIKQRFERDAGCIVDVDGKESDTAEYDLVISVPFLRIDQEIISIPHSTLTIGNAIFAPDKDEPTHRNMVIASKESNKVNQAFNALCGKDRYEGKVAGDELEANIRNLS